MEFHTVQVTITSVPFVSAPLHSGAVTYSFSMGTYSSLVTCLHQFCVRRLVERGIEADEKSALVL